MMIHRGMEKAGNHELQQFGHSAATPAPDQASHRRATHVTPHLLHSFFWPESIAVLGASPDLHRIRGRLLHQLRENGFPGRILPINPSYQAIDGLPCYPTIAAVTGGIDLALIAIPAAGVAAAIEECARAGVKNTLIISSGFAEEGGAASEMQADLLSVTRRTGIRACGPNCEGYYNALGRVATTFSPTVETREDDSRPLVSEKRIGVIAQSGGIGFALFNRGKAAGLGFSYVISTGNEADLTMADFLDYMVEDPHTHAVMLFCEAVRNGPGFVAALEKARRLGQAGHRHQGGPIRCRHARRRIPYRFAVRVLRRLSRRVRTLWRHRGRGCGRGHRHRRRCTDLPVAARPARRDHHAYPAAAAHGWRTRCPPTGWSCRTCRPKPRRACGH